MRTFPRLKKVLAVATVIVLGTGALTSCGKSNLRSGVGYAIDAPVVDYNPSTVAGATGGSRAAFSRVLLGFSYLDGLGNSVADTEFGTIKVQSTKPVKLQMQINPKAVFSDGEAITCEDILFSWVARKPRPRNPFNAMTMVGLSEIADIQCAPQSKKATVTFNSERLPRDWLALFGAGTILPWHIASRETGIKDIRALVKKPDRRALKKLAEFWNRGWRLQGTKINLDTFVSSGPYVLEKVQNTGAITLKRNENWWGRPADIPRITIYSTYSDIVNNLKENKIQVGDLGKDITDLDVPTRFVQADVSSFNIAQIRLSTTGIFANKNLRRAFLSCIPKDQIQKELFPESKKESAAGTPEILGRPAASVLPLGNDPIAQQVMEQTTIRPVNTTTPSKNRRRVSVAYAADSKRAEKTVKIIANSCKAQGFDVIGAPSESYTGELLASGSVQAAFFGTAGAVGPGGAFDASAGLIGMSPFMLPDFRNGRAQELFVRALRIDLTQGEKNAIQADGIDRNIVFAHTIAQLQQYLFDKGYAIPLYVQPRWQFVDPDLQGVTQGRSAASVGWNMDRWTI